MAAAMDLFKATVVASTAASRLLWTSPPERAYHADPESTI
jgi:hypothetical protein